MRFKITFLKILILPCLSHTYDVNDGIMNIEYINIFILLRKLLGYLIKLGYEGLIIYSELEIIQMFFKLDMSFIEFN